MRQSKLFAKTLKEFPREEKSINARFLIRGGFIDKLMAGVYSYLPLGFLVLKKIENVIRLEMGKIGALELLLPALHPKENWTVTDRWRHKEMFKLKSRSGKEIGLGWTHEEIVVPLVKKFVRSFKDLPLAVYQIQDKFRDELRAKSGILRGVEFIMKDLYSFHQDENDLNRYYEKAVKAYFEIFKRCGLGKHTFLTLASGGAFSRYSHEFQTVTDFGEDTIYLCRKCSLALNKEIIEEQKYRCPKCQNKKLEIKTAIEVGNIFKLKDRFSLPFNLVFSDKSGRQKPVLMGCYGIGLGRLMGAVAEVCHDEKGIIWPEEIAPFKSHLIFVENSSKVKKTAQGLYENLQKQGIEVLYDDREDKTAGEKFADADLMGIPYRIVISERTMRSNCVEIKRREAEKSELVKTKDLLQFLLH